MNELIYSLTALALVVIGACGLFRHQHPLRRVLAINLIANAIFLLLVAQAVGPDGVDPVPQAMVLTGIVIAVATTALALALIRALHTSKRQ